MSSRLGLVLVATVVALIGLFGSAAYASAGGENVAGSATASLRSTCKVSPALSRLGSSIYTIKTRKVSCAKANRTLVSFTRMWKKSGWARNRVYRVGRYRCRINDRLGEGGGVVCKKGSRSVQALFGVG